MAETEDEDKRLRAVALQNANAIHAARQRAERELARERERLRITLASIGDAVISTDGQGNVTFLNRVAEALTGWSQAEAEGRPLPDVFRIVNEHTRRPAENPALRALRERAVVGLANHTVLIARDGTERPIDDSAAPIRDEAGTPVGAVLVFRDVTERTRAEEAQLRLAAIVESSDDAIVSKSLDGVIRTWNAGAERLFGYTPEEAVGRPITLLIPPERLAEEQEILTRLRRGERIEHYETVRVAKDGRRLDVSLTVSPLRNPEGVIVGASKIARNITDRKRAEEELRSKTERLNLLVENTKDYAVVISEPDGTVIEWQGGAERITGFSPDEMVGKKADVIFTPEDRAAGRPEEEMRKAAQDGRAEDRRWHLRKDGARFFADGVMTALRDDVGKLRGFGKVFKDATGEEQAKESRREHTERLKKLADVSTRLNAVLDLKSVLGVVTAEGRALIGAHQAVTEVGLDADNAVRSFSFSDELHAGEAALVPPSRSVIYQAVAAGNKPVCLTHAELQTHIGWDAIREAAEGHPPIRGLLAAPIVGPSGGTLGVIHLSDKYAGEFTEEDEAILVQLAQMAAVAIENTRLYHALREGDRKKDDFLALLAHELRNPLAPIRNGLQVIRRSEDRGSRERAQEMMERQLGHMVRLIDDLLDVSRINRNKMELRRARILLGDVVSSAVETARPAIEAAGHELAVALPAEPVFLDADLTRLAQVFSNLLTNSAKYTEAGGRIRLAARVDGAEAVVTVTDTGIGIPADALPHIFDMFSQVDRSIERSTGGLGIGLALVRGLVEMHGGTVSAASGGQGRGSEFTVRLPVLSVRPDAGRAAESRTEAAPGPRRRILVVDDNRDSAESMAEMLRLFGNEVAVAFDGLEAVERAGSFRPDVILMDVGMPRLNGYEATRRIREQAWGKAATIVALTGWGQEGDRAQTRDAGCDGHLVKPISLEDLQKLLGELL
jgi:PAS domain S-box-containing protein